MNQPTPDRLPLVIVGCGRIVEIAHAPALASSGDFTVAGLVDPSSQRRAALRAALGSDHLPEGEDLRDIPVADTSVLVATPSQIRVAAVSQALDAGAAALLVEKPLAADGPTAQQLLDVARYHGTPLIPVHNYRFEAAFSHAVDIVRRGSLGAVRRIRVTHLMTEPFLGAWPDQQDWRVRLPHGCLGDLGYHALYLVAEIAPGAATPVTCRLTWSDSEPPTVDRAEVRLRHDEGIETDIVCSWTASEPLHELRIEGTHGEAAARNDGTVTVTIVDGTERHTFPAGLLPMYTTWYQHAARWVRGRHADSDVEGGTDSDADTAVAVSRLLDHLVISSSQQLG